LQQKIESHKLEHSFIGIAGHAIEPAIRPLGYDWKIGIAIVSSFAAREVFVGTLATIYSVGSDEEETIKNRMAGEVNPILGGPLFNFASGISLLLFYAFAMQCMSTLAIVKRETNSWKWPMYQLVIMSAFAYIVAYISFTSSNTHYTFRTSRICNNVFKFYLVVFKIHFFIKAYNSTKSQRIFNNFTLRFTKKRSQTKNAC